LEILNFGDYKLKIPLYNGLETKQTSLEFQKELLFVFLEKGEKSGNKGKY